MLVTGVMWSGLAVAYNFLTSCGLIDGMMDEHFKLSASIIVICLTGYIWFGVGQLDEKWEVRTWEADENWQWWVFYMPRPRHMTPVTGQQHICPNSIANQSYTFHSICWKYLDELLEFRHWVRMPESDTVLFMICHLFLRFLMEQMEPHLFAFCCVVPSVFAFLLYFFHSNNF